MSTTPRLPPTPNGVTKAAALIRAGGPLIVHVPDMDAAEQLVDLPENLHPVVNSFWPGPLTIVAPLRPNTGISPLVTAGLPTLAIRVPNHPLALQLLRAADRPVAAPSANQSGRISPTTADHVAQSLGENLDAILDGGPCAVGLESTIISGEDSPRLLRPGGLATEYIERVYGAPLLEAD